jgi:hypothetical protein
MSKSFSPADFWAQVDKSGDCWIWLGAPWTKGYGRAFYQGQTWRAHRLAYSLTYGIIPKGLVVCHRCDTRLCVRPDHLFLGSIRDNHRDAMRKGRNSSGEIHGSAKLTQADVLAIQQSHERSGVLAQRYGVDRTTIGRARYGRSWSAIRALKDNVDG